MNISVVISTYNGSKYIIDQLESIRNQTLLADEVLIFDDCSTDNTFEIVEDYIQNNNLDGWEIYRNNKNLGWKENFIQGCFQATGDIVFTCDQDDIWHPEKIRIMSEIMSKHNGITVLVSAYKEFQDEVCDIDKIIPTSIKTSRIKINNKFFKVAYPGCTHCIRKSFIEGTKNYWEKDYPHDGFYWRLSLFSDGLYVCDECLFYWRKHKGSAFSIESREMKSLEKKKEWVKYADRFCDSLINYLNNNNIDDKEDKIDILNRYKTWLSIRRQLFDTKRIKYAIGIIKYIGFYNSFKQFLGDYYLVYINSDMTKKKY